VNEQVLADLQTGIYLERGVPPPPSWRAVFLNLKEETKNGEARDAIEEVMAALRRLDDLLTADPLYGGSYGSPLETLIGYGARFFDPSLHQPPLTLAEKPQYLVPLGRSGKAFPTLFWTREPAAETETDLMIQCTGRCQEIVDRAAVQVVETIEHDGLPLVPQASYDGFKRRDERSWLGFHDGISNLEPSERRAAVVCQGDPEWNRGGTYLAFLRLQIDIAQWNHLSREVQEIVVGRNKDSGCPLMAVDKVDGELRPRFLGDRPPTAETGWQMRDAYFNPPETDDPLVEASHTHRANQNKGAGSTAAAHRIFRQGYEYLEDIGPQERTLGLNFVSFQSDLYHFQQVLGLHGWLGDVNFGGPSSDDDRLEPHDFITLRAGGLYVVPPRAQPFPGASLFTTSDK
jgi:Dyp-type peroxidase family